MGVSQKPVESNRRSPTARISEGRILVNSAVCRNSIRRAGEADNQNQMIVTLDQLSLAALDRSIQLRSPHLLKRYVRSGRPPDTTSITISRRLSHPATSDCKDALDIGI